MDIHLPTRPNMPLEFLKYRVGGVLVIIALIVCGIILGYLLVRIVKVIRAYTSYHKAHQQLLVNVRMKYLNELQHLEGRAFVVAFLSYLERYGIHQNYNSLEEILDQLWIDKQKIEQILLLYYSERGDEKAISGNLKEYLGSI